MFFLENGNMQKIKNHPNGFLWLCIIYIVTYYYATVLVLCITVNKLTYAHDWLIELKAAYLE